MIKNISRNSARCRQCKQEIESKTVYDFVTCSCGSISICGGNEYFSWDGDIDMIQDTSLYVFEEDVL